MNLQRGKLRRRFTRLRTSGAIFSIVTGVVLPVAVWAAAVGSPDVKTEVKKKAPNRSLIKGPKKPVSLNEQNAQKAAQAAQAAKAAAQSPRPTAPTTQPTPFARKPSPSAAPNAREQTPAKVKEAKAKWPVAPKEPVNDVLVLDGGHTNPDGSITIGGTPDEAPSPVPAKAKAQASPAPKVPFAPAVSPTAATVEAKAEPKVEAKTEPKAEPKSAETKDDDVVIVDDTPTSDSEVSIGGDEAAIGGGGEVALDFGAEMESGFNPYVFDRGIAWIFMPMFGLIILGLHLIPVPKRKMKKLIAQTGLFRGLPGKEETRAGIQVPESMRREKKLNETKPMEARTRPEVAVEIQAVPEPKPIPIPPRPASTHGSSIGKVKVKPIPVAVPVKPVIEKTPDSGQGPTEDLDGPTRVASARELPSKPETDSLPAPIDGDDPATRVVSMADQLAEEKENEDFDDGDEATRLYVTKKTSRGGRDEG